MNEPDKKALTANEKAATFIGWEPGRLCENWVTCPMLRHYYFDPVLGDVIAHKPHVIEAPDKEDGK